MAGGQAVPPEAVTLTSHARPSYSERRYPVIPAGAGRRISPQMIQATAINGPPPCSPSGAAAPSEAQSSHLTPRQQDGHDRAGDRPAELTCHGKATSLAPSHHTAAATCPLQTSLPPSDHQAQSASSSTSLCL